MADGLAGDDVDAMAFLAQPDGEVFLGTSSGFSHYVPRADAPRVEPPPVRITSSAIGAKHDFSASFAALTYLKQDLIEYQVRLARTRRRMAPRRFARRAIRDARAGTVPFRGSRAAASRRVERAGVGAVHDRAGVVADELGARAGVAGDRGADRPRASRARGAAAPPQSRARSARRAAHARAGRRQYAR